MQTIISVLIFVALGVNLILWALMLLSIIRRNDLKHSGTVWFFVWLFLGSIGSIIFFYKEGPKRRGEIGLVATIFLVLAVPVYFYRAFLRGDAEVTLHISESVVESIIEEKDDVKNDTNQVVHKVQKGVTYKNNAFGYSFVTPIGVKVDTDVVIYPIDPDEAIELSVVFPNNMRANLSAMNDPEVHPEIRGLEDLSAEAFVKKWWDDNKNDPDVNAKAVVSPIFTENVNGITWYGFTAEKSLVFANNAGGQLLYDKKKTVMIAKHDDTFYRWQFDSSLRDSLRVVLKTFSVN